MVKLFTIGVIGKAKKENEKRVPIHPEHIKNIPEKLRKQITFEMGYGSRFGVDDETLAKQTSGRVGTREEILNDFDVVLMHKPVPKDLEQIKEGAIVWGWPHCVQQKETTQLSIDKKLTLIAWECMFSWSQTGDKGMHTFYKNNELAGYSGTIHALSLIGLNGFYGKKKRCVVISFGSVSRGAICALKGQGYSDITVYTSRKSTEVRDQVPGITFKQMKNDDSGKLIAVNYDGTTCAFIDDIADAEIIVNGILQDTENPKMFVSEADKGRLCKGSLIIDISCDLNMGFWCSRPTSFENPMFKSDGKHYYAVDHSPSFYWNSASWEISKAILPFLPVVLGGAETWKKNQTIQKSIEIQNGVIQNPKILSFQNRSKEYPHVVGDFSS